MYIGTISQKKNFDLKKPRFNSYAVGHGCHGDTKYNRNKEKRKWRKEQW